MTIFSIVYRYWRLCCFFIGSIQWIYAWWIYKDSTSVIIDAFRTELKDSTNVMIDAFEDRVKKLEVRY